MKARGPPKAGGGRRLAAAALLALAMVALATLPPTAAAMRGAWGPSASDGAEAAAAQCKPGARIIDNCDDGECPKGYRKYVRTPVDGLYRLGDATGITSLMGYLRALWLYASDSYDANGDGVICKRVRAGSS